MGEVDGRDRPDRNGQLVRVPDREPLSEQEARRLGVAANRLPRLRHLRDEAKTRYGSISVGEGWGMKSISLGSLDLHAALSLLIERDELLLASFNVTVERTP